MDESVIEEWFRDYGNDVSTYLFYCTRSRDVEDMVQETFLRAIRGCHSFREQSSPKTWLFAIARRVASDFVRYRVRQTKSLWEVERFQSSADGPEVVAERNDSIRRVLKCVDSMKPSYRDVVVLRFIMDMSIADTCQILGWAESRVKVTLHRALREVRNAIHQPLGGNNDAPNAQR